MIITVQFDTEDKNIIVIAKHIFELYIYILERIKN